MSKKSKSKKKAPKASEHAPAEEAPERNLLEEGRQALQLMEEAGPRLVKWQDLYGPQFAEAEEKTARARGVKQIEGATLLGPKIREALQNASPELKLASEATQKHLKDMGPSAIESELTRQAQQNLKLGGRLNADEIRQVTQGSRAATSSRGLGRGLGAAVQEVMERGAASDARAGQRRQEAGAIDAYSQNRVSNDRQFGLNAAATNAALYDPFQRLYGNGGSQVSGQIGANQLYSPYLNASADVGRSNLASKNAGLDRAQDAYQFGVNREDSYYFSEQNLNASNANAAAQRRTDTANGVMSAVGSIAGAALLAFML